MEKGTINEGDLVTVAFRNGESLPGRVNYKPSDSGDCWVIENPYAVVYVQQYETITKLKEQPK